MFPASPSPSASRSRQKTLYVRALTLEGRENFYSMAINHDVSGEEDDGSVRVLTPIKAANVPLHGGFAAVDNKLYCMGGDAPYRPGKFYKPVRSLHVLDTRSCISTNSRWKKRASMRCCRCSPSTVVVYGKIFVFDGLEGPDYNPGNPGLWAEVLDTKSGRWSSFSPPPQLPTRYDLFAVALTGPSLGKILVGSCVDDFFYTYCVEDGHWECWDNKMVFDIPTNVKPVSVDTTLFWFHDCNIYAYDLIKKCSYSGYIKDLDKVVPLDSLLPPNGDFYYPAVHHVAGNMFSFLCLEYYSDQHQCPMLHCVQFCISDLAVQGGEVGSLNATVRSSKAYAIQMPVRILDAVVMDDGGSKDA